ncbi:family 20 glycosylhydrolase [Mucilaginibacter paludis]|uniref:beta-N-acetylhexosaminidase n=1 Tax=Mucilaginibacter paludis DSM 18603 TaxID=714943 RepID=H1Y8C0_9SPHI|nr:family 20 glycosylhydrolase [Mucilaginibacter paludis]EHQ24939.1 Glycoside hydrolase, family 20, catalytic core [Mucilaginibacter paludis DSM 18603]
MITIRSFFILCVLALLVSTNLWAQNKPLPLIPYPQNVTTGTGAFIINKQTVMVLPPGKKYLQEADLFNQLMANTLGSPLKYGIQPKTNFIKLVTDPAITTEEGHHLLVDSKHIVLSAKNAAGILRGIETIRQLLPAQVETRQSTAEKQLVLPAVQIEDYPVYAWRGMHLDVSRHFFSVDYLKKYIDLMALYKFNKLHLHLTDDQGWRIEIKQYPKLTEEGAWRTFNNQDSACMVKAKTNPDFIIDPKHIIQRNGKTLYGGFYTQQQMKDVVAYAAQRHIDVIPEIDMPGHMMAAINNYPFLSCEGGSKWGELFTTPICPCNETTFTFAENIFKEIFEIFPSQYIHIGGDEVDRTSWGKSDACKALMAKEGIKTTAELQSYFINRMEKFFNQHGRKLIGWDEILEGGISPTAIVMYWRSWKPNAPVIAAKNGNKVIMTPGSPLYFDNIPDKNSISNVYHFNPVPEKLNAAEAKNIIGAQANVWTEHVPTENRADYLVFPRMTALAEVLWTNKQDYDGYTERLNQSLARLDALNVHYRLPDLLNIGENNVFTSQTTLNVTKPLAQMSLHYTTDGTEPTATSTELSKPLVITTPQTIKLAAFMPNGLHGDIYNINYQQQAFADPVATLTLHNGLSCNYFAGFYKATKMIPFEKPTGNYIVNEVLVPKEATAPSFGLRYTGYLAIPETGIYTFYLTCDDGGVLNIANRPVVDNDGQHSAIEKEGQVALKQGLQPIALNFIEGGGGYTLKLQYSKDGSAPKDMPADWLKH